MTNISGTSAAGKRTRRARWTGYAAALWALVFSLMHLYWGIEASTTGRLTAGGSITVTDGAESSDWVAFVGILCVMGVIVALLRSRGERMPDRMRLGLVGTACAAMTAYVVYAFAANGFVWLIAPGVLLAVGAVIALALIQPWGRAIPRPLLLLLAWVGGAILILKTLYGALLQALAVFGVITWQRLQIFIGAPVSQAPTAREGTRETVLNFLVWNPWFLLGGVLFCAVAWVASRDPPRLSHEPADDVYRGKAPSPLPEHPRRRGSAGGEHKVERESGEMQEQTKEVNVRNVIVSEFVTLDGVVQDPGWTFQFGSEEQQRFKFEELAAADALLLGRKTYEGFAAAWPQMEEQTGEYGKWMNGYPKHVASATLQEPLGWNASLVGGDIAEGISALKRREGKDILVFGSGDLVDTLVEHDLVDEWRLMVFPIVVGEGKRLFEEGLDAKILKHVGTETFASGVVVLTYRPARDEAKG